MNVTFAYITTRDRGEAQAIGRALIENRLAACVNILDAMESIYAWEGKIESVRETVLIAKTLTSVTEEFLQFVRKRHSYDCPCIVFLPVQGGNPDYLRWLQSGVQL